MSSSREVYTPSPLPALAKPAKATIAERTIHFRFDLYLTCNYRLEHLLQPPDLGTSSCHLTLLESSSPWVETFTGGCSARCRRSRLDQFVY